MTVLSFTFRCTLALLLVVAASTAACRAETLDEAVEASVGKLVKYLESKNETSIAIGQFTGPPQLVSTSGPAISKLFHDHFEKQNIKISRRAEIGLRGEYAPFSANSSEFGVQIKCSLVDFSGQTLTDFSLEATTVDKPEDVVDLLGITAHLETEDTENDRKRDLKKRTRDPKAHIVGTRCLADPASPYSIELFVHQKPLPPADDEGMAFVNLARGDVYTVRIHNDSNHEAAVQLAIDGLSVFEFSDIRGADGKPKYNYYIVGPHQHLDLLGWHKNNETVNSFLITSYAKSAAATIDHQQNIGAITAKFFAAWPKNGQAPQDEDLVGRGDNATGFGPPLKFKTQEVQRNIGRLRAAITLRYDKP